MFKLFLGTKGVIAERVKTVLEERVNTAQAEYDRKASEIEADADEKVGVIYAEADIQKADAATDLVKSILG